MSLLYILFKRWLPLLSPTRKFSFKDSMKSISLWPIQLSPETKILSPYYVGEVFFLSNFMGIVWARSVHQQFMTWYWFSIPYMMYSPLIHKEISLTVFVLWTIIMNGAYVPEISQTNSFITLMLHFYYFVLNCKVNTPGNAFEVSE